MDNNNNSYPNNNTYNNKIIAFYLYKYKQQYMSNQSIRSKVYTLHVHQSFQLPTDIPVFQ